MIGKMVFASGSFIRGIMTFSTPYWIRVVILSQVIGDCSVNDKWNFYMRLLWMVMGVGNPSPTLPRTKI